MNSRIRQFPQLLVLAIFVSAHGGVIDEELDQPEPTSESSGEVINMKSLHSEMIGKFEKAQGFGWSRMGHSGVGPGAPLFQDTGKTMNHQLSHFATGDESFDVKLIGLVKNEAGTVYPSAKDLKIQAIKAEETLKAYNIALREKTDIEPKLDDSVKVELLKKIEPLLQAAEPSPPSEIDLRAIRHFRNDPKAAMVTIQEGNKLITHGPIRASQARCAKCHDVEVGELLGLFRYEFPTLDPDFAASLSELRSGWAPLQRPF